MPKVSVIIPVYNTENFLRKCLDSVCNQTLQDIEIICINDCSTDGSLEILREYAKKDNRIKLVELFENGGAAKARNIGIDIAKGEYIGFVDSDDFIDLDFYEKLYNKAYFNKSEICKGNVVDITLDGIKHPSKINTKIRNNKIYFNSLYCIAIYQLDFVKKNNIIFLQNYCWGEDRLFPIKACFFAKNIDILDGIFYYYKRREGSTTCSQITSEKFLSAVRTTKIIYKFLNPIQNKIICFYTKFYLMIY